MFVLAMGFYRSGLVKLDHSEILRDWRTLRLQGLRYWQQSEVLAKEELWEGAMENAHLAVEIILKAAIAKLGGIAPSTHDLEALVKPKVKGRQTISNGIRGSKFINRSFSAIKTIWAHDMHMRYSGTNYEEDQLEDFLEDYERVFKWINETYVE